MNDSSPAALVLGARGGLPDDIAFLRAPYPRGGWRAHAGFGQLADFWLQVHASLRHEGGEVARIVDAFREQRIDAAQLQRAFVPGLDGFLQHLDQHHRIEDAAYFPRFRQLDDRLVIGFDLLEGDHQIIHQQLIATVAQARGLISALALPGDDARRAADLYAADAGKLLHLLLQHLADEEELVIPAMLKHGERTLR
ncbi:hemerythrin domain-containing protein [Sphingomonas qilianensis]|uniref:Hemerythrin domain-containing protein n=1 Tax=Sphingomonas qilianensis TaxID=1736690 RepID=A0ABU9XQK9_9SPHN